MSKRVSMEEHIKELSEGLFTNITIKTEFSEKLTEVATFLKKTEAETVEGFIDDMYNYLKEEGDI